MKINASGSGSSPTPPSRSKQKHGTRVPLVHHRAPQEHPEVPLGYLDCKVEAAGFNVKHVLDAPSQVSVGRTKRGLALLGVRFDGTLA